MKTLLAGGVIALFCTYILLVSTGVIIAPSAAKSLVETYHDAQIEYNTTFYVNASDMAKDYKYRRAVQVLQNNNFKIVVLKN